MLFPYADLTGDELRLQWQDIIVPTHRRISRTGEKPTADELEWLHDPNREPIFRVIFPEAWGDIDRHEGRNKSSMSWNVTIEPQQVKNVLGDDWPQATFEENEASIRAQNEQVLDIAEGAENRVIVALRAFQQAALAIGGEDDYVRGYVAGHAAYEGQSTDTDTLNMSCSRCAAP